MVVYNQFNKSNPEDFITNQDNHVAAGMENMFNMDEQESMFDTEELTESMFDTDELEELLEVDEYAAENGMIYQTIGNRTIVLTDMAYWKILYLPDWQSYILYHGNDIPDDANPENYLDMDYHQQKDMKPTDDLMEIFTYIHLHDDFRFRMIENIESMPRRTRKQKEMYRIMKRKENIYTKAVIHQMMSLVS